MTERVASGLPFPPLYRHELPLPSDTESPREREIVSRLELLWIVIWQEPKAERENIQGELINRFFKTLTVEETGWVEAYDPQGGSRVRAVLIKERAIQLVKRGPKKGAAEEIQRIKEKESDALETYRKWIAEAKERKKAEKKS